MRKMLIKNIFGSALKKRVFGSMIVLMVTAFCVNYSVADVTEDILEQLKTVQSYEEVAKNVISNAIMNNGMDIESITDLLMDAVVKFADEMGDNISQSIQQACQGAIVGTIQTAAQVGMDVKKNTTSASKTIMKSAIKSLKNSNMTTAAVIQSVSEGTANGVVMVAAGSSDVGIMMDLTEGATEGLVNGASEAFGLADHTEVENAEAIDAASKGCIMAIKAAISKTAIESTPIIEASISGAIKGAGNKKNVVAQTLLNMKNDIQEIDVNKYTTPILTGQSTDEEPKPEEPAPVEEDETEEEPTIIDTPATDTSDEEETTTTSTTTTTWTTRTTTTTTTTTTKPSSPYR
ncbi:MAG: hypothetical protein HQK75_12930 [Candidatus Magnetomorum sp.]|nr:hypothetical protein [Candidatus Magnetomorum sp.]